MSKQSRRTFIGQTAAAGAAISLPALPAEKHKGILHQVYFWLKNEGSVADRDALLQGLETLRKIPGVQKLYTGVPASTEKRDVVDNSFAVSELMFFKDEKAQAAYQVHPVHKQFVERYSGLWSKVIVYDTQVK